MLDILATMKMSYFLLYLVVVLALLSCVRSTDDTDGVTCVPGRDSCKDCYSKLVSQVTGRDENVFNLQSSFFPPEKASPLFLTVFYRFLNDSTVCDTYNSEELSDIEDDSITIWFWSTTSFYLLQPIHVFQYTSLFFSDRDSYASEVCLVLDPDFFGASKKHLRLLTQRVS